ASTPTATSTPTTRSTSRCAARRERGRRGVVLLRVPAVVSARGGVRRARRSGVHRADRAVQGDGDPRARRARPSQRRRLGPPHQAVVRPTLRGGDPRVRAGPGDGVHDGQGHAVRSPPRHLPHRSRRARRGWHALHLPPRVLDAHPGPRPAHQVAARADQPARLRQPGPAARIALAEGASLMRVLVTGATGFICAHLCCALVARGHQVVALVRDPKKAATELPATGVEALAGDLSLFERDDLVLPPCDVVIHLAGVVAARSTDQYDAVNFEAVKSLVRALARQAWGPRRLLFAASVAAARPSPAP